MSDSKLLADILANDSDDDDPLPLPSSASRASISIANRSATAAVTGVPISSTPSIASTTAGRLSVVGTAPVTVAAKSSIRTPDLDAILAAGSDDDDDDDVVIKRAPARPPASSISVKRAPSVASPSPSPAPVPSSVPSNASIVQTQPRQPVVASTVAAYPTTYPPAPQPQPQPQPVVTPATQPSSGAITSSGNGIGTNNGYTVAPSSSSPLPSPSSSSSLAVVQTPIVSSVPIAGNTTSVTPTVPAATPPVPTASSSPSVAVIPAVPVSAPAPVAVAPSISSSSSLLVTSLSSIGEIHGNDAAPPLASSITATRAIPAAAAAPVRPTTASVDSDGSPSNTPLDHDEVSRMLAEGSDSDDDIPKTKPAKQAAPVATTTSITNSQASAPVAVARPPVEASTQAPPLPPSLPPAAPVPASSSNNDNTVNNSNNINNTSITTSSLSASNGNRAGGMASSSFSSQGSTPSPSPPSSMLATPSVVAAAPISVAATSATSIAAPMSAIGIATASVPMVGSLAHSMSSSSTRSGHTEDDDDDDDHDDQKLEHGTAAYNAVLTEILDQSDEDVDDDHTSLPSAAKPLQSTGTVAGAGTVASNSNTDTTAGAPSKTSRKSRATSDAKLVAVAAAAAAAAEVKQQLVDVESIKNPIARAEAVETNQSRTGNYSIVSPLRAGRRANSTKTVHNILKLRQLAEVQEQMIRYKENFGIPTCAVTHVRYLAIGMSRGIILVFDHFQKLAMGLGNSKEAKQRGAPTAIDFSPDGDHIIAGHDSGHIALWDLLSKTCLKLITEGPPVPIISLRFVKRGPKFSFIAADRDGTVDLYTISKYVFAYSTDKQCLLQGRAGAIYATSVLLANPNHPHLCDRLGLIALSNESVTIIVALEPSVRILFRVPRPANDLARPGALPFLSWRPLQSRDRDRPSAGSPQRELDLISHPVLAISRGRVVELFQIQPVMEYREARPGEPQMSPVVVASLGDIKLDRDIIAVEWLGGQVLVAVTDNYELRVIDPMEMTELEKVVDAKKVGLIYHERFENPETKKPEFAHHPSVRANDNSLLLLGIDQVMEAKVLSWGDRVNALVTDGNWIEALALALDFYEGCAKAAIGLPRGDKALKSILSERIVELLQQYVALALNPKDAANKLAKKKASKDGDTTHWKVMGAVAVDYCIIIGRTDMLFGTIYQSFCHANAGLVLLELLEPYILNDRLHFLSPEVMKAFVSHYHARGKLQQVEQCILHMDVSCLDFQQIVLLCRQHYLFSALIHVYNRGMGDYRSPMEESLRVLIEQPCPLDEPARERLGYKLLLYVSYCFLGRGFPRGSLSEVNAAAAKAQVLALLFTKKATGTDVIYPWLSYLLNLNTKELLRLLAIAYDNDDWVIYLDEPSAAATNNGNGNNGAPSSPVPSPSVSSSLSSSNDHTTAAAAAAVVVSRRPAVIPMMRSFMGGLLSRQAMFDVLADVILAEAKETKKHRSALVDKKPEAHAFKQSADRSMELYKFAAIYMSKTDSNGAPMIKPVKQFTDKLLQYLCQRVELDRRVAGGNGAEVIDYDARREKAERQATLLRLLDRLQINAIASGAVEDQVDMKSLLQIADDADMYEVCIYILKKRAEPNGSHLLRVIDFYLKKANEDAKVLPSSSSTATSNSNTNGTGSNGNGEEQKVEISPVFDFLSSTLSDASLAPAVVERVRAHALKNLPQLVKANSNRTARLMVECFAAENDRVVDALANYPELQFSYLKSIILARDPNYEREREKERERDGITLDSKEMNQPSMAELLERSGMKFTPKLHETYIRLLCRYSPKDVYHHLTLHHDFNLELVLKVCKEYQINDASAYLLERTGDTQGALDLTLQTVDTRVARLRAYVEENYANIPMSNRSVQMGIPSSELRPVEDIISVATLLCQRSLASEPLWFALLDKFMRLQRTFKPAKESSATSSSASSSSRTEAKAKPQTKETVYQLLQAAALGFVRTVLHNMMGHVSLTTILKRITTKYVGDEFREFRDTIQGMLDTYAYEQNILSTTNKLLAGDMYRSISLLHKRQGRAFVPRVDACGTCSRAMSDDTMSARVTLFDCGHAFHESCLGRNQSLCPICQKETKSKRKRRDTIRNRNDADDEESRHRDHDDDDNDNDDREYDDGKKKGSSRNGAGASASASAPAKALSRADEKKVKTLAEKKQKAAMDNKTRDLIYRLQAAQRRQQRAKSAFIEFNETLRKFDRDQRNGGGGSTDDRAVVTVQSMLHLSPLVIATPVERKRIPGRLPKAAERMADDDINH